MAAIAVAGLPWLAAFIGSILSGLISFFARYFSKKWAVLAAVIVAITATTVTFIALIEGLMAGITTAAPSMAGWGLLLPDNLSACVAAYITARIAKWVYYWHTTVIQWKLL